MSTLRISPMSSHPALLDQILLEYEKAWPKHYGPSGPGIASVDVMNYSKSGASLPIGFIGFHGEIPIGSACLRSENDFTLRQDTPWIGALLIFPGHRGRGFAKELINHIVESANNDGYDFVMAATSPAPSIPSKVFSALSWGVVGQEIIGGESVTLWRSNPLN